MNSQVHYMFDIACIAIVHWNSKLDLQITMKRRRLSELTILANNKTNAKNERTNLHSNNCMDHLFLHMVWNCIKSEMVCICDTSKTITTQELFTNWVCILLVTNGSCIHRLLEISSERTKCQPFKWDSRIPYMIFRLIVIRKTFISRLEISSSTCLFGIRNGMLI